MNTFITLISTASDRIFQFYFVSSLCLQNSLLSHYDCLGGTSFEILSSFFVYLKQIDLQKDG